MKRTRLSALAVDVQAAATAKLLDGGLFDLMTGDQPDFSDDDNVDEFRLARLSFGSVAFGSPKDGVIEANPLMKSVATQTGEPTWVRCRTRDGRAVFDGNVGKADANCIVKVETIVKGTIVDITRFRHVISKTTTES